MFASTGVGTGTDRLSGLVRRVWTPAGIDC